MSRLWQVISAVLGALSVLFYVSNKSKDRQIEKHKDEAERNKSKAEQEKFKADAEKGTKHTKDRINSASELDTNSMLHEQNALRDERD